MAFGGGKSWLRAIVAPSSLVLGLVVAEAMFAHRDHDAFPFLHAYVADAKMGVRLRPGEHQRYARPPGAVTTVRINQAGYRGAEFPPPSPRELLIAGDSQVFGLGVEEHETMSAVLAERLGASVLNLGVPSYGPFEVEQTLREVGGNRLPAVVVAVLDLATDPLELEQHAAQRVTTRGGWLVSRAAKSYAWPGEDLLRDSHVLLAWRRAHAEQTAPDVESAAATALAEATRGAYERTLATQTLVESASQEAISAFHEVEQLVVDSPSFAAIVESERKRQRQEEWRAKQALEHSWCDCFYPLSDPAQVFASELPSHGGLQLGLLDLGSRDVSTPRSLLSRRVERQVLQHVDEVLARGAAAQVEEMLAVRAAFERRDRSVGRARDSHARERQDTDSIFAPTFAALLDASRVAHAKLVVVVLPLRSQTARAVAENPLRYTADMTTEQLAELALGDALAAAGKVADRVVDVRNVLFQIHPTGFLQGDGHLSAQGHAAVANALGESVGDLLP